MRILLVGEYSRLHNSLKEGLLRLGHEVVLVSTGDQFKNYPADLSYAPVMFTENVFFVGLKKVVFRLSGIDLSMLETAIRFRRILPKLKDFDCVQLINSNAIETFPAWQIKLYKKLFKQNKKIFLLICGDETPVVEIQLQNKLKRSALTPILENPKLRNKFRYSLKYVTKPYRKLFAFVQKNVDKMMVSDLDYLLPMKQTIYKTFLIPNPVNVDILKFEALKIEGKIVVFHGINRMNYLKKGNHFFEEALKIISKKYADQIEIITAESLPYADYILSYNRAHILLDQVFACDQGYHALEAMAKGKVVFTGAESAFMEHYKLSERVAVNAIPNVDSLVEEISFLIENPAEIIAMGKRARDFIEKEHHYVTIAKRYLDAWE
ncbi:MAG: glycosyltransferase [Flavobacteriaceae bacterium]|nr:glycosyltransferase [Flavobacteriaceae bacterium]MDZ4149075.1 glycosyltransferase [Flavobacteriaceae bacterium]